MKSEQTIELKGADNSDVLSHTVENLLAADYDTIILNIIRWHPFVALSSSHVLHRVITTSKFAKYDALAAACKTSNDIR